MLVSMTRRSRFGSDEDGVSTIWSIFWTIIFLVMAGLVIDVANSFRFRTPLQATADSAALGGIMAYRESPYYETFIGDSTSRSNIYRARAVAERISTAIMSTGQNGTVVDGSRVEAGNWDGTSFDPTSTSINAVRVTALRTRGTGNQLDSVLLGMFGGLHSWDVGAVAIAESYKAACAIREGIMAANTLDMSSRNAFYGDLCLHGEVLVDMQNHNSFHDTTGVNYGLNGRICRGRGNCGEDVVIAGNPTLQDRLSQDPNVMPDVPAMFAQFQDVLSDPAGALSDVTLREYLPNALVATEDADGFPASLITNPDTGQVRRVSYSMSDFNDLLDSGDAVPLDPHTIYEVMNCSGNRRMNLDDAIEIRDVVILTDCRLMLSSDVVISGSLLLTSYGDTSYEEPLPNLTGENDYRGSAAVHGSAGATIGTGTCANPAGASQIIAAGDIDFAAGLNVRHSQILTKGDTHIAAQPDGMEGTSIWARGDVSLTSNGRWRGCATTPDINKTIPNYFRLVY